MEKFQKTCNESLFKVSYRQRRRCSGRLPDHLHTLSRSAGIGFDPDSPFAWLSNERVPAEKIYLGIKDDPENCILVWEKGTPISPATEAENREHMRVHVQ